MTKVIDDSNLGYLIGKINGSYWKKTDVTQIGIDTIPTQGSDNLVSSGGVFNAVNGQYIEAWDGASAPVAANIPAGVSVTYGGATTTGTLAASASTRGKIYLVSDGNGQYDRYYTSYDGSSYSWAPMGSTAMDLSGYAHQEDLDAIEEDFGPIQQALLPKTTETTTFKEGVSGMVKLSGTGFYGGKNIPEYEDVAETTTNDITWKIEDGIIYLNGTASGNAYIKFPITPVTLAKSASMNLKCWVTGTISSNINIWLGSDSSKVVFNGDLYSSSFSSGVSDTQKTTSNTYDYAPYMYVFIASGIICTNVTLKPMITYSARYGAGDYEPGGSAVPFSGDVMIQDAQNICVQGGSAITITHYDLTTLDALPSMAVDVQALLGANGSFSASGTNVCKAAGGLIGSGFSDCKLNGLKSGTVQVIGKNLLDVANFVTTGSTLQFTPIALRPNTTYYYFDDYGLWHGVSANLQIYAGSSADDRAYLCAFVDSNEADRTSYTFTTGNDALYWLRYYPNNAAYITDKTTNLMLVEGDHAVPFEEYKSETYDLASQVPVVLDDPCYLFAPGNTITCSYYAGRENEAAGLPSYWQTYMEGKLQELYTLMASTSMHSLIFQFITDVHLPSNAGYSPQLVKMVKDKVGISDIVFGGDIIDYDWNDGAHAVRLFYQFREKYLVADGKTFCLRGNHDAYHNAGDSAFYNVLVRPLNDRFNTNGYNSIERVYYYIDDASQKVRLINFDSGDWSDREFKAQFDWLVATLNGVPSGWGCVLFSHIVVDGNVPANDIREIVKAFINRSSGSRTLYNGETVTYDFTSAVGEMICIIGGHSHRDWSDTAVGCPCIATTCDAINAAGANSPTMTPGTTTEQAFDIFFIDMDARTITAKRIGAGSDRSWNY